MEMIAIAIVAFLASMLTFFSGFGLGTLLLPVFALFFPIEVAVAGTGIVHLLNNLFKISLVFESINYGVIIRFGLPGIVGSAIGAYLLINLNTFDVIYQNQLIYPAIRIDPINLVVGVMLIVFSMGDLIKSSGRHIHPKWIPIGGLLSGFFGGLSGHQGALRSAFLIRLGLTKEVFIASGIAIACMIDLIRIPMYLNRLDALEEIPFSTFGIALVSAFVGAFLGKKYLTKISLELLHRIVAIGIIVVALLLIVGWI